MAQLEIQEQGISRRILLDEKQNWSLGRLTPGNYPDIPLVSAIASREHGWFIKMESQWYYVDNPKSLNGTFYNGRKIAKPIPGKRKFVMLKEGDELRIDNEDLNAPNPEGVRMIFRLMVQT